jgi:hypothetical protein
VTESTAIVLQSDQFPMSRQQCFRSYDCGDLREDLPAQLLGFGGKPTQLIISKSQASPADLFS